MIGIISEGLMLGLSTGIYCLGTCLIFFMPYLMAEGTEKLSENSKKIAWFLLGRLLAYLGFALIMGIIKEAHRDIFTLKFSYASLIAASLVMLLYALTHNFPDFKFCKMLLQRIRLLRIPFFLGFFSGLNPCAPFLVGVTRLLTLNSILAGVVLFSGFFLGTSVFMIPLAFVSYLNRIERVRQIGLILALLCGAWFLVAGISGVIR